MMDTKQEKVVRSRYAALVQAYLDRGWVARYVNPAYAVLDKFGQTVCVKVAEEA